MRFTPWSAHKRGGVLLFAAWVSLHFLLFAFAQSSAQADPTTIAEAQSDLERSKAFYAKSAAPIERRLKLNIKLLRNAQARKKAADEALKAKQKGLPWYRKLIDDAETDNLQRQQGAAESEIKTYVAKINSLQGSLDYLQQEQRRYNTETSLNITRADPAAKKAEIARREKKVQTLNGEYYTQAAQKTAGEIVFDQKLATFDQLMIQARNADQDDVANAIGRDRALVAQVKAQWLKGQETALASKRGQLDQAYASNKRDGLGPAHWSGDKRADSPEFIDREAVESTTRTATEIASSALANTRQDMSVTAFLEDYGKTALFDEKTGNFDPAGVATRYGAYAKGSARAAKDAVVDLAVLTVVVAETAVEATQVAIEHHTGGKKSQVNRGKITALYGAGNAVADLADADSPEAQKRREQISKTVSGVLGAGDRKLEKLAGMGEKGVLQATEYIGYGVTTVVDPLFNSTGLVRKADKAGDLGNLGKLESEGILKRLDTDALDARAKLNELPGDEFIDTLKKNGLEPKRTVEVRGEKFHLSEPFEGPGGRTMVVALQEGANGKVVPRTFYLSGEHGVWRAAPAQMFGGGGTPLLNKGPTRPETGQFVNEGVVDLDAALQGKLDTLTNDLGVKKLDGDAASKAALGHLELATAEKSPNSLKVDAKDGAKPIPRDANGNLPEAMRPDWANGLVSNTVITDHPLYGTLERFVYKSKDGATDWIVNRAENGDVWIASMQDARAGITGQGTRGQAWQAADLTRQPWTKDVDGNYVPAEGWKNPVNDYMARNLPGAPEGAAVRAPIGVPSTPNLARQTTHLGQTAAQRARAIQESNMVPEHAEAFRRIAQERGEIIMVRPVNPHSTGKIADDAATKGMNIKGKSTDWGPDEALGLIPVDSRYSKLGNPELKVKTGPEEFRKYSELNKKALGEPYHTPIKDKDGNVIGWQRHEPVEAIAMQKALTGKDGQPILGPDGKPLMVLAERVRVLGKDGKPQFGPDGKPLFQAGNPITADYDLFAVGSRKPKSKLIENDPEMGTISEREVETMEALNKAVQKTGYKGGKVVHHGPANRFADFFEAADFPITVILPNGEIINLYSANEVLILYQRMARSGFNIDSMPGWNFGITDPQQRIATARKGAAKGADRRGRQAQADTARAVVGEAAGNLGRTLTGKPRLAAGKAANSGKDEDATEQDFTIGIGSNPERFALVDPIYFEFGPNSWLADIESWVAPGKESLVSLGSGVTFEVESAISVAGTNTHSSFAIAAQMLADSGAATPAPPPAQQPVRDAPSEAAPPPVQETPPQLTVGPPAAPTQPPKPVAPKPEEKPPVLAPPAPEKELRIRIGTTRGGARHKSSFSFACFSIQLAGDTDEAESAEVSISGPGDDGFYRLAIGLNARIEVEHKIYSYGTYNFEVERISDKQGQRMEIEGSTRGSYQVTAEEAPCF
ncbi:MAG: anthrax toxin-like adenylyl cyclase domain-containing protein [Haliea sp.]|uniref:anthrax toxin-like adenylyl cyclase domain-containing protein n=1 Tax=Haliea sp. TaxID=1932666 RepID=UPI0032EBBAD2